MLSIILIVFALVLAILAGASNPPEVWRGRLICFALACFFAAELLKNVPLAAH